MLQQLVVALYTPELGLARSSSADPMEMAGRNSPLYAGDKDDGSAAREILKADVFRVDR